MGVKARMSEKMVKALDEVFGPDMFELFGDVMDFIPREAQFFHKKYFPEPVFADQLGGDPGPFPGQLNAAVSFVMNQSLFGELFQHVGDRCGPVLDSLRNAGGAHGIALTLSHFVNGFEIIFFRQGIGHDISACRYKGRPGDGMGVSICILPFCLLTLSRL